MTDLEIMYHRFSHQNVKSPVGKLAKELGMTTAEYRAAVKRGMEEENKMRRNKGI